MTYGASAAATRGAAAQAIRGGVFGRSMTEGAAATCTDVAALLERSGERDVPLARAAWAQLGQRVRGALCDVEPFALAAFGGTVRRPTQREGLAMPHYYGDDDDLGERMDADMQQAELEAAGREHSIRHKKMLVRRAKGELAEAVAICSHGSGVTMREGTLCRDCGSMLTEFRGKVVAPCAHWTRCDNVSEVAGFGQCVENEGHGGRHLYIRPPKQDCRR